MGLVCPQLFLFNEPNILMIIGIDASNILAGGGLTHIHELLRAANPSQHGFYKVIVWGAKSTLDKIDNRDWLYKVLVPLLDQNLLYRLFWQRFRLKKLAEEAECNVVFILAGYDVSGFKTVVTMSQNLLPFEWKEMRRDLRLLKIIRLLAIRFAQIYSFRKAKGVIFLTAFARDIVLKLTGPLKCKTAIIPHGVSSQFFIPPRQQIRYNQFNIDRPCRIIYVSIVDLYKHHTQVVEAVAKLRSVGIPVVLELIGPHGSGIKKLNEKIQCVDVNRKFVVYSGAVSYNTIHALYSSADIGVFASSCETFGMILLEMMSAGLPVACSNRSSMPEVLGDAGLYFDPESSDSIALKLRELIASHELREKFAQLSFERAQKYSWAKCADETFGFLSEIAKGSADNV